MSRLLNRVHPAIEGKSYYDLAMDRLAKWSAVGRRGYLEKILDTAGSNDPFEVFNNSKLVYFNLDKRDKMDNVLGIPTEIGAMLEAPNGNRFFLGFDGFKTVKEVWGLDHIPNPPSKEQSKKDVIGVEEKIQREFAKTVLEIKQGLKSTADIQSTKQREEVSLLLGIEEERLKLIDEVNELTLNSKLFVQNALPLFSIRGPVINALWENRTSLGMSDDLLEKLALVRDPKVYLPTNTRLLYLTELTTYSLNYRIVNAKDLLGDVVDDIRLISELPIGHKYRHSLDDGLLIIQGKILANQKVSLQEVSEFVRAARVRDYRIGSAMDRLDLSDRFKKDFLDAFSTFHSLYRGSDGEWLAPSMKSVPTKSILKSNDLLEYTSRDELKSLHLLQVLYYVAEKEPNLHDENFRNLFAAVGTRKSQELIDTSVSFARKKDSEYPSKNQYIPLESFAFDYGVGLDRVLQALVIRTDLYKDINYKHFINRALENKIVSESFVQSLLDTTYNDKDLLSVISSLIDRDETIEREARIYYYVYNHPLVISAPHFWFRNKYLLLPEEADSLKGLHFGSIFVSYEDISDELDQVSFTVKNPGINFLRYRYEKLNRSFRREFPRKNSRPFIQRGSIPLVVDGSVDEDSINFDFTQGDEYIKFTQTGPITYVGSGIKDDFVQNMTSIRPMSSYLLNIIKSKHYPFDIYKVVNGLSTNDFITKNFANQLKDVYKED